MKLLLLETISYSSELGIKTNLHLIDLLFYIETFYDF